MLLSILANIKVHVSYLYLLRPPVVVFVNSKAGTLLLAEAINKVII